MFTERRFNVDWKFIASRDVAGWVCYIAPCINTCIQSLTQKSITHTTHTHTLYKHNIHIHADFLGDVHKFFICYRVPGCGVHHTCSDFTGRVHGCTCSRNNPILYTHIIDIIKVDGQLPLQPVCMGWYSADQPAARPTSGHYWTRPWPCRATTPPCSSRTCSTRTGRTFLPGSSVPPTRGCRLRRCCGGSTSLQRCTCLKIAKDSRFKFI